MDLLYSALAPIGLVLALAAIGYALRTDREGGSDAE